MEVSDALLAAARNYLDITWEDADGDVKLRGILARGIKYLDAAAGVSLDYSVEDIPRALLFDYARYDRAGARDEFENNYLSEILALQIKSEVEFIDSKEAADVQ